VFQVGCLFLYSSTVASTAANAPAIPDAPPAPMLEETDSFMGAPVGATVRVKCTAPRMELNNARLLAVTRTDITVVSANGERFVLPKDATTIESPVAWQRTLTVQGDARPRSGQGIGRPILVLVWLAGAAAAVWFWRTRRAEPEPERIRHRRPAPAPVSGKIRLSTVTAPAATAQDVVAAPPAATPLDTESDGDVIEDLIKSRCYGTALEKVSQQIRLQPDEFRRRLQLLRVYVAIGDSKQMDRVLHEIQAHPGFSAEQKGQAAQAVPASRRK
jgi:hypothetical protein